jgi:hypothetical protein
VKNVVKIGFNTPIQAIGTAFLAMKTEVHKQTKEELVTEEANIGQMSDVSKLSKTSAVEALSPSPNEQTVIFADPINGNLVKLNLSNENINKLKKHFGGGEDNFYERKDRTLRLNGEVEAHVSGWFGDIAYKREFLQADADKDGKLSKEEYNNTKNEFIGQGEAHGVGENIISIKEQITEQYVSVSASTRLVKYDQTGKQSSSIEEELNRTLKANSNIDSYISLQEAYSVSGKKNSEVVLAHAKKAIAHDNVMHGKRDNPFKDKTLEELGYYLEKTDSKEATKILEKLKAANGDESTLNMDEREVLGVEIIKAQERKVDLSAIKEGIKASVETTRFIDVKG